ncbi:MAG: YfhO family protein [Bacteroidales bacterium]|nr:YfhO family protein [Bacteroidales bacterium]
MKEFFKKYGAYLVAALVFLALTIVYCWPSVQGKVLSQSDNLQWKGMAHELKEYNATAETPANWTNSMFGGMPGYQITVKHPSNAAVRAVWAVDRLFRKLTTLFTDSILALLLGYFLGFFIMMRAFGINKWLSIVGSIAVSMSSYFFLIIPAGHETKALTLGMMAPVIGGFYLIFRKKYGWGIALVMLYSSIGMMKHPQMSYYLFMMMGLFGIAEIVIHIKEKRIKDLLVSLCVFAFSIGIGVGTGYSIMKANSEYVKETVRGGHSDIRSEADDSGSKGLDIDYATAWSYGIDETLTLMIPGYMGGASSSDVGRDSKMYKTLIRQGVSASNARSLTAGLPTYWGEQPFTAGPVYVGAIVCFLFLLGCLIVKGPYKWALLAATLFSILLSWGHNLMGLTELFYYHFPMYNKFRTVSSILVVAEVAMPLLGFLALEELRKGDVEQAKLRKSLLISAAVTGGICLLIALFGRSLFSFSSSYDARTLAGMPQWFMDALQDERASMLVGDAWRSAAFIALSAALVLLFSLKKLKFGVFAAVLGVLVVADMWPVNKRYFGDKDWVSKKENDAYFRKTDYEEILLKDPEYFRVMNLTTNTFNESRTSYYLHSIGGYHAAKLRRYQDLIDYHLSKGNMSVINMLNTKYIIQEKDGKAVPVVNPGRFGNAWFVDEMTVAGSAREESDALNVLDLRTQAVTDAKFSDFVLPTTTGSGTIELTSYAPDRLSYKASLDSEKTAVFSEIYYPHGWKAYIDGQPASHFRADYALRALNIPAGDHEIVFEFRPDSIYKGFKVNAAFLALMYLLIALMIAAYALHERGIGPEWIQRLGGKL